MSQSDVPASAANSSDQTIAPQRTVGRGRADAAAAVPSEVAVLFHVAVAAVGGAGGASGAGAGAGGVSGVSAPVPRVSRSARASSFQPAITALTAASGSVLCSDVVPGVSEPGVSGEAVMFMLLPGCRCARRPSPA